jgi:hypothetical protein
MLAGRRDAAEHPPEQFARRRVAWPVRPATTSADASARSVGSSGG